MFLERLLFILANEFKNLVPLSLLPISQTTSRQMGRMSGRRKRHLHTRRDLSLVTLALARHIPHQAVII